MTKLNCVDMFSGVGGLTLALQEFCHVTLYCEWDPYCQAVLAERMSEGRIDKAPIHTDIKTLHLSQNHAPSMICGGFPCQDISSMGLQKGITDGERSSMFFHMMRIVDDNPSINVIFLENVANILNCGMQEVVTELQQRGFSAQWTVRTATAQGAPHVRARWFCLAVRDGASDVRNLPLHKQECISWWDKEPCPRFTLKSAKEDYDANWVHRCHTLGNAVVPSVARAAFIELATCHAKWDMWKTCLEDHGVEISQLSYPFSDSGLISNGMFYAIPKTRVTEKKHIVDTTIKVNDEVITLQHWPTPRRGLTHGSSLTERGMRDLPTVLLHSEQCIQSMKRQGIEEDKPFKIAIANVNYIEWMMGFEKDWTKIQGTFGKVRIHAEADVEDTPALPTRISQPKTVRLNGMHMLMREHRGKDIRTISDMWRNLSDEEKRMYSQKAKEVTPMERTE